MPTEIGAFEAKNRLGSLLDRVEQGESIVITRHGKAVASLVPHKAGPDQTSAQMAAERIRNRAKSLGRSMDWAALKAERDEDRP